LAADPPPSGGRLRLQAPGTFQQRKATSFISRIPLTSALDLLTNPPTKTGGHYTAHALQADGRWYRFNDAAVTHVPGGAAQVGRERAYMLVYQRVA
jgi:ubiquitin C-terminal hydrolase